MDELQLLVKYKLTKDKNIIYYFYQKYREQLISQAFNIVQLYKSDLDAETDFDVIYYNSIMSACKLWRLNSRIGVFTYRLFAINKMNVRWHINKYVRGNETALNSINVFNDVVTYDGSFGTTEDLHSDVIENEQEKILLKYLKQFPKDFRRIILLKYRGFSDEEIMVKTKVSQAKIRGKFNHFKRKFREDIIEKRRCIS